MKSIFICFSTSRPRELNLTIPWWRTKTKLVCCRVKVLSAAGVMYTAKDLLWGKKIHSVTSPHHQSGQAVFVVPTNPTEWDVFSLVDHIKSVSGVKFSSWIFIHVSEPGPSVFGPRSPWKIRCVRFSISCYVNVSDTDNYQVQTFTQRHFDMLTGGPGDWWQLTADYHFSYSCPLLLSKQQLHSVFHMPSTSYCLLQHIQGTTVLLPVQPLRVRVHR